MRETTTVYHNAMVAIKRKNESINHCEDISSGPQKNGTYGIQYWALAGARCLRAFNP
jgi:hypothetical protein